MIPYFLRKSIFLATLLAVGGCYKEYSEDFIEEETITQNAAIGQQLADDVLDIVYRAEVIQKHFPDSLNQFPGSVSVCGTISDDGANKVLTIDYGEGCTDGNGRFHSGSIMVNYDGTIGDTLADRTVSFSQYRVNGKHVEGNVALHDAIVLPDGMYKCIRTLTDFKVSFPDGTDIRFNGDQERFWISGRGDSLANNNRYTFAGAMSGVSSTGRAFTQDVITPFIADLYASSQGYFARTYGVVELSKLEGYPDRKRSVDYGRDSTKYDNTVSVSTFRRTYGVATD